MNRLSLLLLIIFSLPMVGLAQTPELARISKTNTSSLKSNACADQFAGTIEFDFPTFNGESNDINNETKYFCLEDELQILHNGDFDLTGDPNTSTDPAVGYAFYECRPTIDGPDRITVITDPCMLFNLSGNSPFVVVDDPNGDALFFNRDIDNDGMGGLQEFFNNGDPVELWFAPMTFDDFDPISGTGGHEGTPAGPCVNVNLDEAFSVVYLNALQATAINPTANGGSFRIEGGLPEWDGSDYANIDVRLSTNPAITGTVTSANVSNQDFVNFTVPQDGIYDITVEDEKSCPITFQMSIMQPMPLITFEVGNVEGAPGSNVCVQITTEDFTDVVGFQFGLEFDPTLLTFTDASLTSVFSTNQILGANLPNGEAVIGFSWFDLLIMGNTYPDGTAIVDICFDVIGNLGDCSPLTFTQVISTSETSVGYEDGTEIGEDEIEFINGEVCIDDNDPINPNFSNTVGSCAGNSSGGFSVSIPDGVAPYSIQWQSCSGGPLSGPFPILDNNVNSYTGLDGDDYCVTITDSSTPTLAFSGTVEIPAGPSLGLNVIPTLVSCFQGMDGTANADLSVDGSPEPNPDPSEFTFEWEDASGNSIGNTQMITGLSAGQVFVTVTDVASGCTQTDMGSISQFPELEIIDSTLTNPTCPGETSGTIVITVDGGNPPYSYAWDTPTGMDFPFVPGLGAGTYCVSVTDANNCGPIIQCFTLEDPPSIEVTFSNDSPVSCFNGIPCDGEITATAAGGTVGTYTFNWPTGVSESGTASTGSLLCQGPQTLNVNDGQCGLDTMFIIDAPDSLGINTALTRGYSTSCHNTLDGAARVVATGGTAPYTYTWTINNMQVMGDTLGNLPPDTYNVLIQDDNGCTLPFAIAIEQADSLEAFIDTNMFNTTATVSCFGETDGSIAVAWTGGNAGQATYTWNPAVNTSPTQSTVTGLAAGTYEVTVTDVKGCVDSTSWSISEPSDITAIIPDPDDPPCAGSTTFIEIGTATGGSGGPFTYSINNGVPGSINTPAEVLAGTYLISVFDVNQCVYEEEITILDPQELIVDLGEDIEIQLGDETQLDALINGPNSIDSLFWTPDVMCADTLVMDCQDPVVAPLNTTVYSLTVLDDMGCIGQDEIVVEVDANRNVYIPNVFSPNADGINDFFTPIIGSGVRSVNYMRVFDRWGQLVYEQRDFLPFDDFSTGWDGKFKGKEVNTGVFVYLIEVEFIDDVVLLYRGDITALY